MSIFRLSAAQVYAQVLETLGARGLSSEKQTAVQRAIQMGLSHIYTYHSWSWRIRRTDVSLTAATPYYQMPEDYESLACAEIVRYDTTDGIHRTLRPRTDRDFWRAAPSTVCNLPGTPEWYRIVTRTVGSTNWYCLEGAPAADRSYKWRGVEYYRSCPELSFTESTAPEMPTEFYDLWATAAEWRASKALGRHKLGRQLKADLEEALSDAVRRYDITFQDGPPQGLESPYGDELGLL